MATVLEVLAKLKADTADFERRMSEAERILDSFARTASKSAQTTDESLERVNATARRVAVGVGVMAGTATVGLISLAKKSFAAAAQVEELDTVMQIVGGTTGQTYERMSDVANAIRKAGIEMATAQQTTIKFAKNQLDLSKAVELATVAQDFAVISQANSTETLARFQHAILRVDSQLLKNAGLQTTANQALQTFARENNIAVESMTLAQKQQAVLNAIIEEGATLNGVYKASMENAGKVLRSFKRITNDIQISLGNTILDGFAPLILKVYEMVSAFKNTLQPGGAFEGILKAVSSALIGITEPINKVVSRLKDFFTNVDGSGIKAEEFASKLEKFLPIIGAVAAGLATFAGKDLLKMVPVFGQIVGALNPFAVALVAMIALAPKLQQAFFDLVETLGGFLPTIQAVGEGIMDVLAVGIDVAVVAVRALNKALKALVSIMPGNTTAVIVLAGAITAGVIAFKTMAAVVLAYKKVQQAYAFWTYSQAAATGVFRFAMSKLNTVIKANPIGAVVAVVIALGTAFILAWRKSETFRKGVISVAKAGVKGIAFLIEMVGELAVGLIKIATGPLRLLLKGLDLLGVSAAGEALRAIDSTTSGIGKFFDNAANKVRDFADQLDKLENFGVEKPGALKKRKKKKGPTPDEVETPDGADDPSKSTKALIANLKKAVEEYNIFINEKFVPGFFEGGEKARETIRDGLDNLEKVFAARGKMLKGKAKAGLVATFEAVKNQVNALIPQAMATAEELKVVSDKLEKAKAEFEQVLTERAAGASAIGELLATPFGEPSQLLRALSSSEATVDSIISTYDSMVDAVTRRFEKMDDKNIKRDALINYLTEQTQALVDLARKREVAVKTLLEREKELADLLAEQESFIKGISSSLGDYGKAIADLSTTTEKAVLSVVRNGTQTMITQLKAGASGINKIIDQFEKRLKNIRDFTANVNKLLAMGLDKGYLKQLVAAGPEAAGEAVAALAKGSQGQIEQVNKLYGAIENEADKFSQEMGSLFYSASVATARELVKGAQDEVAAITAAMTAIKDAIGLALSPLSSMGANLGNDMMQGLIDSLTARKTELLDLAKSIAAEIAAAMASAAAAIGTKVTIPDLSQFDDEKGDDKDNVIVGDPFKDANDKLDWVTDQFENPNSEFNTLKDQRDALLAQLKTASKSLTTATKKTVQKVSKPMSYNDMRVAQIKAAQTPEMARAAASAAVKNTPGYKSAVMSSATTSVNVNFNNLGRAPSASEVNAYVNASLAAAKKKRK